MSSSREVPSRSPATVTVIVDGGGVISGARTVEGRVVTWVGARWWQSVAAVVVTGERVEYAHVVVRPDALFAGFTVRLFAARFTGGYR